MIFSTPLDMQTLGPAIDLSGERWGHVHASQATTIECQAAKEMVVAAGSLGPRQIHVRLAHYGTQCRGGALGEVGTLHTCTPQLQSDVAWQRPISPDIRSRRFTTQDDQNYHPRTSERLGRLEIRSFLAGRRRNGWFDSH
jgi:hypothetical protein